jgi:hypothetical protein
MEGAGMNEVRFGMLQDTALNRAAYKVGTRLFALPEKIGQNTDRYAAAHAGTLKGKVVKKLGTFTKNNLVAHEYQDVTDVGIGKRRFFVAPTPPRGAVLLWLYPGTILARAIRAYERGKENGGDYREVFDVLRRDVVAVTLFVFMLNPLVKKLNTLKQKMDGLEIVDRAKNEMLDYRQFDNYNLDNKQVLIRMLEEGNGKGLMKAARIMLNERGLSEKVGSAELASHIGALQRMIPELVAAHERKDYATRDALADNIIKHVKSADALTAEAYEKVKQGGTAKMAKELEKLQGSVAGFVKRYAQTRRLPADMLAFGIVVLALGYFPVWFNSLWNRKQFEEKKAANPKTGTTAANPQVMFQASPSPFNTPNAFQAFNSQPQRSA